MPSAAQGFAVPLPAANAFPNNQPQPGGPYVCSGAPLAGTSCVQTVTIGGTPTGGTFTLTFAGQTTGSIAWTATDATLAANIAAALNGLSDVGPSGTVGSVGTGSSGIGTYLVTFQAQNAALTVPPIMVAVNALAGTSPTVAVAVTTPGVSATMRGCNPGTVIADYTVPKLWLNASPNKYSPSYVRHAANMAVVPLIATTSTSGGAMGVWVPPEGAAIVITRLMIYVATASSGAANVTAGQGASASTSYTNLVPATSVHTSGAMIDSITAQIQAATAAESGLAGLAVYMPAGNYLTFSGSASTAGLVATAFIPYFVP